MACDRKSLFRNILPLSPLNPKIWLDFPSNPMILVCTCVLNNLEACVADYVEGVGGSSSPMADSRRGGVG